MKRTLALTSPVLITGLGLIALSLALPGTVLPQGSAQKKPAQQKPAQKPRRPLPKPVAGTRGFEQYAGRDASARLIAGAGTREVNNPATPFYDRGEANYGTGKYKEAVDDFSQAVHLRPEWAQAHYALALSLTETGKLKAAIEEFKQVLGLNPRDELKVLSYYNIANAYADLGQYKVAIESYKEAIRLSPKLSKPHNNLGLAYVALDQIPAALAEFKEAVQLKPDFAEAHFNLGVAYLQSAKKHEAEEQQQILTKLDTELASKLDALIKQ